MGCLCTWKCQPFPTAGPSVSATPAPGALPPPMPSPRTGHGASTGANLSETWCFCNNLLDAEGNVIGVDHGAPGFDLTGLVPGRAARAMGELGGPSPLAPTELPGTPPAIVEQAPAAAAPPTPPSPARPLAPAPSARPMTPEAPAAPARPVSGAPPARPPVVSPPRAPEPTEPVRPEHIGETGGGGARPPAVPLVLRAGAPAPPTNSAITAESARNLAIGPVGTSYFGILDLRTGDIHLFPGSGPAGAYRIGGAARSDPIVHGTPTTGHQQLVTLAGVPGESAVGFSLIKTADGYTAQWRSGLNERFNGGRGDRELPDALRAVIDPTLRDALPPGRSPP